MTLVIMAAGIGSRFGTGIKQLQTVDSNGHIIMDYSIHDAVKAGFKRIVFIIRRDIEAEFKEVIGTRIENVCRSLGVEVLYAYQEAPDNRKKPYGTGHAVLSCKDIVKEPFAVLNADDYYGKSAFQSVFDCLSSLKQGSVGEYCLAGFVLKNTLSENGGVTRGICKSNADGYLTDIVETKNIIKTTDGAETEGKKLDADSLVSMNMWGFTPDFFELLDEGFRRFLAEAEDDPTAEFLVPVYIGELLKEGKVKVKTLQSPDRWFGMTYREDIPTVVEAFEKLYKNGEYLADLYSDLG